MKPLELGVIAKPHGLRGELKVKLHWADSDALCPGANVTLRLPTRTAEVVVQSVRAAGKGRVVVFSGITDRDQAEAWAGASVLIDRAALPALEPGEYYLVDLLGAEVTAPDGVVGRVVRVATHPSVDAVVIETPEGTEVEQPLLDEWLSTVDAEGGRIVLVSRDGLI